MNTQSSVGSMSSLCTTHLAQKAWGRSWGLVRGVERRVRLLVFIFAQSKEALGRGVGRCKLAACNSRAGHASEQASERTKQGG